MTPPHDQRLGIWAFSLENSPISIGRDASNSLVLSGIGISRFHASLERTKHSTILTACDKNIVLVNHTAPSTVELAHGDIVTIGVVNLRITFEHGVLHIAQERPVSDAHETSADPLDSDTVVSAKLYTLGRDASNTLVIDHPLASRFHATISLRATGSILTDLGSTNGVYVNGCKVRRILLTKGDIILVGPRRFSFDGVSIIEINDHDSVTIEASHLVIGTATSMQVRSVNCTLPPGEFIVLLGPSGAGKTSLINALAGLLPVRSGTILYNGLSHTRYGSAFAARIGYVAQDTRLHEDLTVWETFAQQSILRLPKDWSRAERHARIDDLLTQLSLVEKRNILVRKLSGGEKKRVHLGIELLPSPAVLFLDEPLAGLDSGLVCSFMELFKRICDKGHTLVLTTHTLDKLDLAHRVLFMRDGALIYNGPPQACAQAFEVPTIADVYTATTLPKNNTTAPTDSYTVAHHTMPHESAHHRLNAVAWHRQLGVLFIRYCTLTMRDTKGLFLLMGQPAFILFLLTFLYSTSAQFMPVSFYFCIAISVLWCSCANASSQITREWAIYDREFRCGLSAGAFTSVKIAIGSLSALLQATLFWILGGSIFHILGFSGVVFIILLCGSLAGMLLGLCISTVSRTPAFASGILPLVFIPQIFFSGALVPLDSMPLGGAQIALATLVKPIFSLLKQHCILGIGLPSGAEWISLEIIGSLLIIFMYSILRFRTIRVKR